MSLLAVIVGYEPALWPQTRYTNVPLLELKVKAHCHHGRRFDQLSHTLELRDLTGSQQDMTYLLTTWIRSKFKIIIYGFSLKFLRLKFFTLIQKRLSTVLFRHPLRVDVCQLALVPLSIISHSTICGCCIAFSASEWKAGFNESWNPKIFHKNVILTKWMQPVKYFHRRALEQSQFLLKFLCLESMGGWPDSQHFLNLLLFSIITFQL